MASGSPEQAHIHNNNGTDLISGVKNNDHTNTAGHKPWCLKLYSPYRQREWPIKWINKANNNLKKKSVKLQ